MTQPLASFVLLEPQFVLRRTMVMVARDMAVVDFAEASNVIQAQALLAVAPFQGLVLSLQDGSAVLGLLEDIRTGKFSTPAEVQVIALAVAQDPELEHRLASLGVKQILHKPVKVSTLLKAISTGV